MDIAVIGSGYVGTTLAAGLADIGHQVTAVDIDRAVVDAINAGEAPIHEPGLDELISRNVGDRLQATTDYAAIVDADLVFVAVQTPSREDGSIDVSVLREATLEAARTLAAHQGTGEDAVLVVKSTVTPPQLGALQEDVADIETEGSIHFGANPEFLREGSAVADFRDPDKVVFGVTSSTAETRLREAFDPIVVNADPSVIVTDPPTAAMIKYSNNAFLAAKISLINDLGNICKEFGIDAYEVAEAIGTDHRISERFLRSGVGFGGSCFPKDVDALIAAAHETAYAPTVLEAVVERNDRQPARLLSLLEAHVALDGARIAVLGLAFKPGTDDVRNSRAIPLIEGLDERGAEVVAYDPVAIAALRDYAPDLDFETADSAAEALAGADGAVVATDWDEFAALDEEFDEMAEPIVIDGRRIIQRRDGITYEGLTW